MGGVVSGTAEATTNLVQNLTNRDRDGLETLESAARSFSARESKLRDMEAELQARCSAIGAIVAHSRKEEGKAETLSKLEAAERSLLSGS